tara:strand:+ start:193 stop:312 length:120 start_codon:yes stop_codon:yes gene_type:complete
MEKIIHNEEFIKNKSKLELDFENPFKPGKKVKPTKVEEI